MKKIIPFIFLSIFLMQCKSVYVPPSLPVPLIDKAGELQLDAGTGGDGTYFMGAYGFTDNISAIAGYSIADVTTEINGEMVNTYKNRLTTLGLGYSQIFSEGSYFKGIFEVYGGGRFGHYNLVSDSIPEKGAVNQFFVQSSLGAKSSIVDGALSLRYLTHHFSTAPYENYLEVFLTLKGGYKFFKLTGQFGYSFYLFPRYYHPYIEEDILFHHFPLILNFGVQIDLFTNK